MPNNTQDRIRVKVKATGQFGTIPVNELDPNIYEASPASPTSTGTPPQAKESFAGKTSRVLGGFFGGNVLGEAIGTQIAKGTFGKTARRLAGGADLTEEEEKLVDDGPSAVRVAGDVVKSGANVALVVPTRALQGVRILAQGAKALQGGRSLTPLAKESVELGAISAILGASDAVAEGQNIRGTITSGGVSGAIGAATPRALTLAGKGVSKLSDSLPTMFNLASGGQKKAFEFMLKNPQAGKTAREANLSFDDVLERGQGAVKSYRTQINDEYVEGVTKLKNAFPKSDRQADIKSMPTLFNNIGKDFNVRALQDGSLAFSKGGRIARMDTSEQKRVKEVFGALKNWKDFSAGGTAELIAFLNSKKKFTASNLNTETSAYLSRVEREVRNRLLGKNGFPELKPVLEEQSRKRELADQFEAVFKTAKEKDPNAQAASVKRIARIADEDREPLFRVAEQLEKETGVSLIKELAAAETAGVLPSIVRTIAGIGGTFAVVQNPLVLALLPLFTERGGAAFSRGVGRALQQGDTIREVAQPIITRSLIGGVDASQGPDRSLQEPQ